MTSESFTTIFCCASFWFVVDLQAARGVDTDSGSPLLQAVLLERSEKAEKHELLDGRSHVEDGQYEHVRNVGCFWVVIASPLFVSP
jgi:hypothetical protein